MDFMNKFLSTRVTRENKIRKLKNNQHLRSYACIKNLHVYATK